MLIFGGNTDLIAVYMCGWVDYKLYALSSGAHLGSDFLNSCMINKPFFVEQKETSVLKITALLQELIPHGA